MAETQPKRLREEEHEQEKEDTFSSEVEITKRHKSSYNQILSILDETTEDEHQEPTQDLTDFFTSLQQELSSSSVPLPELTTESDKNVRESGYEDKEMVIRHLLEASDDELGIPNRVADGDGGDDEVPAGEDGGFPVALCDGLWELEDDAAANCYTLIHSELIMQ